MRKRIREDLQEQITNAYQKKAKISSKDENTYPKFLLIESRNTEGDTLTKLSPFAVSKYIENMIGTVASVKRLRSGSLLIETASKIQTEKALRTHNFGNTPIKISPHSSMNKRKGVIRCPDFRGMSDDDLQVELSDQNITEVKRMSTFKNNQRVPTDTFIITFNTHTLPNSIKAGYLRLPVSLYIPQPLRCFKCQKYGHHKDKCRSVVACQVCSEEGHDTKECTKTPRCRNCEGSHPPSSKKCPTWEREKQIIKVKTEQNISFPAARRLCELKNTAGPVTYAQAAATAGSSVSRSTTTVTTKSIQTQTDIKWPINSNTSSIMKTKETQTQTQNPHQNPAPKTPINKPGPASSKKCASHQLPTKTSTIVKKSSQNSDRSKPPKPKKSKNMPRQDDFELEITNRFSDLDGDIEDGEAMDYNPAESSSSGAIQAANTSKVQTKLC